MGETAKRRAMAGAVISRPSWARTSRAGGVSCRLYPPLLTERIWMPVDELLTCGDLGDGEVIGEGGHGQRLDDVHLVQGCPT